jgi:predicted xylose isomerase-like sugar epimerase
MTTDPTPAERAAEETPVRLTIEQCAAQFENYAKTHPSEDSAHSLRFCANFIREFAIIDAHVPAEARDLLDEALRAGLQAAKACPLNTTYHERVMNEARAFLASNEDSNDSTR